MGFNSTRLTMRPRARVIHRVTPYPHEDLTGFLMRVAVRNHMLGPSELLSVVTGTPNRQIQLKDLPILAELCRSTAQEVYQLSGYEWRINGEDRNWRVNGEWITKSVFISLRQAKVCPACLQERNIVRGEWSLSFYTVCAHHETHLLERCPACRRKLQWNRRYPDRCICRFNLAQSPLERSDGYAEALSKLLAYSTSGDPELLDGFPLDSKAFERLAGLSLDGICKTVWFLGHCLPELGNYGSGHGRKKPGGIEVEVMAEHAFKILNNWPDSIGNWLDELISSQLPIRFSATAFERLLAPMQHYFLADESAPELKFLTAAFEQHLRRIWFMLGQRQQRCRFERQLELDFGTYGS